MTDQDLTPRELAIVELASGRPPLVVALGLGVPEAAVRRVGGLLGWPQDTRQIKRAASAIKAGQRLWAGELAERPDDVVLVGQSQPVVAFHVSDTEHGPTYLVDVTEGQAQPAPEATDDEPAGCPDECSGCSCHVGNSAPCNHCTDDHDDIDAWLRPNSTPITDQGDTMPKPTTDEAADEAADALGVLADVEKLTTSTDHARLTLPLATLTNADGESVVLVDAVVDVRLVSERVLDALDERQPNLVLPLVWSIERQVTSDGADAIRQLAALLPPDADR